MRFNENELKRLFTDARSIGKFKDTEVTDEILKELYELTSMGPTAFNAQPARFIFLKSPESKEKLRPFLMEGNIEKTMKAPVTVIVSTDYDFYHMFDKTFPIADIKPMFVNNEDLIKDTALRNSVLAGGYFIMAARALGLDVGAMSGFNNAELDKEFFAGTNIKSNFLINLGYGDYTDLYPRLPRLSFDSAAKII